MDIQVRKHSAGHVGHVKGDTAEPQVVGCGSGNRSTAKQKHPAVCLFFLFF